MTIYERALEFVAGGMAVGLGSGRAATEFTRLLGERVRAGLRVRAVTTSVRTTELAAALGIPVVPLGEGMPLDLAIGHDGARCRLIPLPPPDRFPIVKSGQRRQCLDKRSRFLFDPLCEKSHKVRRCEVLAMDFSLSTYYPIFIYLVAVLAFAVAAVVVPHLVAPKHRTPVKQMPYESGMDPIGSARQRFDVKFYLIAILFLVFDVELLFLYPWAASYEGAGEGGSILPAGFRGVVFWEVVIFLATVVVAYVYAWRRGVFRWR